MQKKTNVAILVNSCDKYEDAWNPFFKLFSIMWHDCPYDIYLNSETKEYNCSFMHIKTICGGKNLAWSERLKNCLSQIDADYIILLIEDFFLMSPVNENFLNEAIKVIIHNKRIGFISFNPDLEKEGYNWDMSKAYNKDFNYIGKKSYYRINAQANLWRKSFLVKMLRNHENAWEFEDYGTVRAKIMPEILLTRKVDGPKVFDYHYYLNYGYGLKQGKWLKNNKMLFDKYEISVDYDNLGYYQPQKRMPRIKRKKSEILKLLYQNPKEFFSIIINSTHKKFPFIKAFF